MDIIVPCLTCIKQWVCICTRVCIIRGTTWYLMLLYGTLRNSEKDQRRGAHTSSQLGGGARARIQLNSDEDGAQSLSRSYRWWWFTIFPPVPG